MGETCPIRDAGQVRQRQGREGGDEEIFVKNDGTRSPFWLEFSCASLKSLWSLEHLELNWDGLYGERMESR